MQFLDLPFDIQFSHITKLILKIPLYNLSKSPVEIELDGLFVIIRAKSKEEWNFID
jgi:hypothetical protein